MCSSDLEPRYLEMAEGLNAKALRFVPLAEQPRQLFGHVVCARTPFGEAVIRRVDALLARPDVQATLTGYYERWLDDESRQLARAARAASSP